MLEYILAFQYENQPHKEFSNGYTYKFSTMVVKSILIPKKINKIKYLNGNSSAKTAFLNIGGKDYKFLLDKGATISSICQDIFNEL